MSTRPAYVFMKKDITNKEASFAQACYSLFKYKVHYEGLQQHFNLRTISFVDNRMTNATTNKR